MAAAEIRDRETGLVSEPFLRFQYRQIFRETQETEANSIFFCFTNFPFYRILFSYKYSPYVGMRLRFCIENKQFKVATLKKIN